MGRMRAAPLPERNRGGGRGRARSWLSSPGGDNGRSQKGPPPSPPTLPRPSVCRQSPGAFYKCPAPLLPCPGGTLALHWVYFGEMPGFWTSLEPRGEQGSAHPSWGRRGMAAQARVPCALLKVPTGHAAPVGRGHLEAPRGRGCLGAPARPCLAPQHVLSTRSCSRPHREAASDGERTWCQGALPPVHVVVFSASPPPPPPPVCRWARCRPRRMPLQKPCSCRTAPARSAGTASTGCAVLSPCLHPSPSSASSASAPLPSEPRDAEAKAQHCRGCLLLGARLILAGAGAGKHDLQGSAARGGFVPHHHGW